MLMGRKLNILARKMVVLGEAKEKLSKDAVEAGCCGRGADAPLFLWKWESLLH